MFWQRKGNQYCVACPNNTKTNSTTSYFRLPKDENRYILWREHIGIQKLFSHTAEESYKRFRLCGKHFEEGMFSSMQMNRLKRDAVPTLFLEGYQGDSLMGSAGSSPSSSSVMGEISSDNPHQQEMAGGKICCVAACKSNSKDVKNIEGGLRFFSFPKTPEIRREWVRKCNREYKFTVGSQRICSKHFKPDDFEDLLKATLLKIPPRKLKGTAVPSLFLSPENGDRNNVSIPSERSKRAERKERKAILKDLLQDIETKNEIIIIKQSDDHDDSESLPDHSSQPLTQTQDIREQYENLQRENSNIKQELAESEKNKNVLQRRVAELEREIELSNGSIENRVKELLKDVLSPNQVDIALNKNTRAKWTSEELSKAFTLRYLGTRSYNYLRDTLNYPVPGISTLQRWVANINARSGMLSDILRVMETVACDKNEAQRATVLSFDVIKVSSILTNGQQEGRNVGPRSRMLVIMARGLFDKWSQPIYIESEQKITKELLKTVITKLHTIKYDVVACVSGCDSENEQLWKALGINVDKTFFDHPVTEEPVYFFVNVPHLLKHLRNWFIDTGFTLEDGTTINKTPVEKLIECWSGEVNQFHKVKNLHLNCSNTERQDVTLALELFSYETAAALQYHNFKDETEAIDVGIFIELVKNWFDIMNSCTHSNSVSDEKPYGLDLEKQDEILQEMIATIGGMVCDGKKSVQSFQRGIIISTTSLQHLYLHLEKKLGATYILTQRLNMDCLENLVSQLRTGGGLNKHLSPLEAWNRIRLILLGEDPGLVQTNMNVNKRVAVEHTESLLYNALKKARIANVET